MTRSLPPRPGRRRTRQRPPLLLLVAFGALAAAGLAALIATGIDDGSTDAAEAPEASIAPVTVDGGPLPPFAPAGADPAVGEPAPVLRGTTLDGDEITVPTSGRPAVLLFVAHWCPHCQAEVPEVQDRLDDGALPEQVDLVTVSTGIDPDRPGYPPSAWLAREGWSAPTVTDSHSDAAEGYGLSSFPYWVVVDADGDVVARHAGRVTSAGFDALVAAAQDPAEGAR